MAQLNVERVIGRLLTDEVLRRRFLESPARTLDALAWEGWRLSETERESIASLDHRALTQLAERVDSRIRRAPLDGGAFRAKVSSPQSPKDRARRMTAPAA